VVHAISRRHVILEARVQYEVSLLLNVIDIVEVGEVFLHVIRVSPVSIIPPVLHTRLYIPASVTRKSNGRTLELS
jgi:hypothetical protein